MSWKLSPWKKQNLNFKEKQQEWVNEKLFEYTLKQQKIRGEKSKI